MRNPNLDAYARKAKVNPHIVRKDLKTGPRYYVYAWRGGPLILRQDHERPDASEVLDASRGAYNEVIAKWVPPRPKYMQALIDAADGDRWTYFIGCPKKAIKIGAAGDVESRLRILQAHSPIKIKVLAVVRGGETLESAYHAWFSDLRLHGEWFEPHPKILAEIDRLNAAMGLPLGCKLATPA